MSEKRGDGKGSKGDYEKPIDKNKTIVLKSGIEAEFQEVKQGLLQGKPEHEGLSNRRLRDLTDEERKELLSPLAETVGELKGSFSFAGQIKGVFPEVHGNVLTGKLGRIIEGSRKISEIMESSNKIMIPINKFNKTMGMNLYGDFWAGSLWGGLDKNFGMGDTFKRLGQSIALQQGLLQKNVFGVKDYKAFIDREITRKSKKLWEKLTPIMEIWEITFMFFPPPYGFGDRRAFAKSVIHAIERLRMPVDGSFRYCRKKSYEQKIRAPIDVDVFFEYVRSGYVDGVLESEAWRWVEQAKMKYGGLVRSSRVIEKSHEVDDWEKDYFELGESSKHYELFKDAYKRFRGEYRRQPTQKSFWMNLSKLCPDYCLEFSNDSYFSLGYHLSWGSYKKVFRSAFPKLTKKTGEPGRN